MKINSNKILIAALLLASLSCSSKDEPTPPPAVIPVTPITTVTPSITEPNMTTANVKTFLVDKDATLETVAMFYNLKKLAKTKIAIGQQGAFTDFYQDAGGDSDIKKTTGSDPAILGSDFMFITDKMNDEKPSNWFFQQEQKTIDAVIKAYNKGVINTFCWHLREPIEEKSFYVSEMTNAQKMNGFKSIMPGGTYHEWYKKKLDKIALVFGRLKGSKGELIPVIFRPFHEFDGSWFWWGADFCSPEEYKTMYKFTVDYLKTTKGVHNLLFAFGPDNTYDTEAKYLSRYPGDEYVDVLGMDNYWDLSGKVTNGVMIANKKLGVISDLAKARGKIAALTETGYQITSTNSPITGWFSDWVYPATTNNNVELSFVMFWGNDKNAYFVPSPAGITAPDFKTYVAKPQSVLLNELPKMYELPK